MVSVVDWPEPTIGFWDRKNVKLLTSYTPNTDFVGQNNAVLLLSGRSDLNTFVKENRYNPYYHDEQLYPFDGYAIKVFLEISDGRSAGICIGTMCLEFSPNYSLSTYTFYSFTAK